MSGFTTEICLNYLSLSVFICGLKFLIHSCNFAAEFSASIGYDFFMSEKKEIIHAEIPENLENLRVTEKYKKAAGLPAILQSMQYSLEKMGAVRTFRTLLTLNQKGGFDCQSCAWGDPDDDRKLAEFCENGARAVADEATKKLITADFFQKHSVAELSEQSDFWLNQQGRLTQPMFLAKGATHYAAITWERLSRFWQTS